MVTYNSDFGDIREFPPGSCPGVIRLRVHPQTDEVLHPRLAEFLSNGEPEQLCGALVILDNIQARIRKPR